MKQVVLEKLEWPILVEALSAKCRTADARARAINLRPELNAMQVRERWNQVEPLRQLLHQGYTPPLDELPDLSAIFRAIELGQIISGKDLRDILQMLLQIKNVHKFCTDFAAKCSTLRVVQTRIYPLPRIMSEIERTVGPDGELLDDASPELQRVRQQKLSLRKRIETVLRGLFQDSETLKYLQDEFFTIRSERYVIPMALDGRGRIKGSIYDTSDSGQTLYIEPTAVAPLNEELLELDLAEKLEILRIFRELGAKLKSEMVILRDNYHELVQLDGMQAEAHLAVILDARAIDLTEEPGLHLRQARHPVLSLNKQRLGDQTRVVPCDVDLAQTQRTLIISGPNAGGKTVVLKTVGLIHAMAKAGLLVPADAGSRLYLYKNLFFEVGDAQNLVANLSTFSGHIMGLRPIVEQASATDLVLLDEIAAGTEPQAGSALAQSVLEHLAARECVTIVTTHFEGLKTLAKKGNAFRNASMEYALESFRPTYRLILDQPGQSYGIEMATQLGLPQSIIERAHQLRGSQATRLDESLKELQELRTELRIKSDQLEAQAMEMRAAETHWQNEKSSLAELRQNLAANLAASYEEQISDMREQLSATLDAAKDHLRKLESQTGDDMTAARQQLAQLKSKGDAAAKSMRNAAPEVRAEDTKSFTKAVVLAELKLGLPVILASVKQQGIVTRIGGQHDIEVQIGALKMRADLADLFHPQAMVVQTVAKQPVRATKNDKAQGHRQAIAFTPKTSTNSVDLRGLEADVAVDQMLRFVDQAFRKNINPMVVIHGHGTNRVKNAVRSWLSETKDYQLRFRPGDDAEGGDGVTIVAFDR